MLCRPNPTVRFSTIARDYAAYRPGYPSQLIGHLRKSFGLQTRHQIADVGSGTGKLTEVFLRAGNSVNGIEPNQKMRSLAEEKLEKFSNFRSYSGTAENTGLVAHSIDFVVSGQAFHWFDLEKTKNEFTRILRSPGIVATLWNMRLNTTPFMSALEQLISSRCETYNKIGFSSIERKQKVVALFDSLSFREHIIYYSFPTRIRSLLGFLRSASYVAELPNVDRKNFFETVASLFRKYQVNGGVELLFKTEIFSGALRQ